MARLLILSPDGGGFTDLAGRPILPGLGIDIVVVVDKAKAAQFHGQAGVAVEAVRFRDFATSDVILRLAEKHHRERPFTAVATLDELAVTLAAGVRQALGIPGLDPAMARRFRDKVEMKIRLAAAGIRVPRHVEASDPGGMAALLRDHGKIVIKPRDDAGSRDVRFIDNAQALEAWQPGKRGAQSFEAEEFIDGTLYHLNSIVQDGEVRLTACAPYLPGMGNIDFPEGTPFATVMLTEGALHARLTDYAARVVRALEMPYGVTHLECFVTPAGEIVFCEIAIRPGGGGIAGMIESQYGVNFAWAALQLELGRGDAVAAAITHRPVGLSGLVGFRTNKGGLVRAAPGPGSFGDLWIDHAWIPAQVGAFQAPAAHCTDFLGLFIFRARDAQDYRDKLTELERRFYTQLSIESL